jgi:hypothetical protein
VEETTPQKAKPGRTGTERKGKFSSSLWNKKGDYGKENK